MFWQQASGGVKKPPPALSRYEICAWTLGAPFKWLIRTSSVILKVIGMAGVFYVRILFPCFSYLSTLARLDSILLV
jgi:hypothetical protein